MVPRPGGASAQDFIRGVSSTFGVRYNSSGVKQRRQGRRKVPAKVTSCHVPWTRHSSTVARQSVIRRTSARSSIRLSVAVGLSVRSVFSRRLCFFGFGGPPEPSLMQ